MNWKMEIVSGMVLVIALIVCVILGCANTGAEASYQPTTESTAEEATEAVAEPTQAETIATEGQMAAYTEQDLEYLALAIYQEAGADYCTDETRLMVGTVIMNRVADPRFPDTISGVLTQKHYAKTTVWAIVLDRSCVGR